MLICLVTFFEFRISMPFQPPTVPVELCYGYSRKQVEGGIFEVCRDGQFSQGISLLCHYVLCTEAFFSGSKGSLIQIGNKLYNPLCENGKLYKKRQPSSRQCWYCNAKLLGNVGLPFCLWLANLLWPDVLTSQPQITATMISRTK